MDDNDLVWTTKRPTEPGAYFYRIRPHQWRLAVVIDDRKQGMIVYLTHSSFLYYLKDLTGEWAGPLRQPKEG